MRVKQLMVILGVIVPTASSAEMAFTDMYVGGFGWYSFWCRRRR